MAIFTREEIVRMAASGPLRMDGADLSGIDVSGIDLSGSSFVGANCRNTRFSNCNLSGCTFDEANVEGADFAGVRDGVAKNQRPRSLVVRARNGDKAIFDDWIANRDSQQQRARYARTAEGAAEIKERLSQLAKQKQGEGGDDAKGGIPFKSRHSIAKIW